MRVFLRNLDIRKKMQDGFRGFLFAGKAWYTTIQRERLMKMIVDASPPNVEMGCNVANSMRKPTLCDISYHCSQGRDPKLINPLLSSRDPPYSYQGLFNDQIARHGGSLRVIISGLLICGVSRVPWSQKPGGLRLMSFKQEVAAKCSLIALQLHSPMQSGWCSKSFDDFND